MSEIILVCMRRDDLTPIDQLDPVLHQMAEEVRARSRDALCENCHHGVIYDPVAAPFPLPPIWCARCAYGETQK